MTSTPVSVGTRNYVPGQMPTVVSSGNDTTSSFSDVLKNQKSGQKTESDKQPVSQDKQETRIADRNTKTVRDVVKPDRTQKTPEEANVTAENVLQEAAGDMLEKTADELDIPADELMEILNSLSLTAMDLLQPENLQAVVIAAAGETDACSLVTNEQMFATLQNLTNALADTVEEVAEAAGLKPEEVQNLFAQLKQAAQTAETVESGMEQPVVQDGEEEPLKTTEHQEENEQTGSIPDAENDGSRIMLERSLSGGQEQGNRNPMENETRNPFAPVQTVQNQAQEIAQTVETAAPTRFFDADTEMIMHQITDYMKAQVTEGVSELEMQLHPESLGSLHIKLTAKDGTLTAQFAAQNETVKAALESQMIQLKETFREQGISVEAIEVTVQSHRFDQQYSGGNSNMQGEDRQPGRPARRRINLNLPAEEELTEDEQLAADMLRESGGTVDYTV